jgi:RNA polymerase sigma factor (sigma-70 family)
VRDSHLAEDATQATFLVLARNPAAARQATSVAGWLFGIARRVGSAARRHELRRQKRELQASPACERREFVAEDLLRVLDEELAALPEDQRSALIACYLREQTQDEAARELCWSLSTLRRRLERGKAMLRTRLARRGVALSSSLLFAALAPKATAAVSLPAAHSPFVKALAAEAMRTASTSKLAFSTLVMLLTGGLVAAIASVPPPPTPDPTPSADVIPIALPAPVPAAEWVKLKGRVVFPKKQDIPPRIEVKTKFTIKDADHCLSQGKLYFEDLLIDPENRGIKNCVVFLRPDAENRAEPFPKDRIHPMRSLGNGSARMLEKPKAKTHNVTIECCQFEPRVLAVRGGDMVRFKNESKVAHNANYQPPPTANMDGFNVLLPMDKDYTSNALTASRSPSLFRCNIHPWMQGYVWTFDHPYFTVTAADGSFTIPDAPVGKWRVVVWHEKVGYRNWQVKPLGELSTLKDDGKAQHDLGNIEFDSDGWVEKKDE